jgi:DNA invertase Pin-like site-specific DNA recombinase
MDKRSMLSRRPLKVAGAEKVFSEKISGAVTERRALARAIDALAAGDTLVVTRLARSTRDLLNVLDAVGKAGADFRSIADAWADTSSAHGRLMLTVLGGLAEFERELIKARTDEGRKRAKARGIRFGRKPKLTLHQRQRRWRGGRLARRWSILAGAITSATQRFRGCSLQSHSTSAPTSASAQMVARAPMASKCAKRSKSA